MRRGGEGGGLLGILRRRLRLRRPDGREPGDFNHVSLGSNCQMAHALKTLGLRTWSGPFDWVFTLPPMVRDCLADDCRTLADRAQLETIPLPEREGPDITRGRHRLYREHYGLDCIFNHHDPAADDADFAFLQAGVRRLRAARALAGARNRYWLLSHLHVAPADVSSLCDVLAGDAARSHLTVIQLLPGAPAPRVAERAEPRPDLLHITLETPSAPVGLRLADPADDARLLDLIRAEAACNPAHLG
ncbi:DUF1796 family putative cysteine peptidase [Methylobacterium radiodurans]|uniref:Peptidase n=1 Tax=Methylobacterium radiodurans TaxID=2202828 RepID=A0A2U8VT13_9HYPH|nr:DUF1796 family putative cysteine peptidase [Methylobacterium radiodurans]AWN36266.1 peptidase [Methylobacterium radiodurans]